MMKVRKLLAVCVLTLLLVPLACAQRSRSAGPEEEAASAPGAFDRTKSAGFFLGVHSFTDQQWTKVAYSVDDAVDLAWAFALDPRIRLIPPERVVLCLSGTPRKDISKQRLEELKARGAIERSATQAEIAALIERQAASAGEHGLFIAVLATHGYMNDGVPYVLASSSVYGRPETALSTPKLLEIVSTAGARRSLIFIDACRERLTRLDRSGEPDPEAAAPLLKAIELADGQAVFYGAPAGGYAYDDPKKRNGVFSEAVLEGLRCQASKDARGFVTVDTLSDFVEERVRSWVSKNRPGSAGSATQTTVDGATKDMPLVQCQAPVQAVALGFSSFVLRKPARVDASGDSLQVFDENGMSLWNEKVEGEITQADMADLDGDGRSEVIVGLGREGKDGGKILAFGPDGGRLWTADTNAPSNYDEARPERLGVTSFLVGDLFARNAGRWWPSPPARGTRRPRASPSSGPTANCCPLIGTPAGCSRSRCCSRRRTSIRAWSFGD